jgi:hypothetical protein
MVSDSAGQGWIPLELKSVCALADSLPAELLPTLAKTAQGWGTPGRNSTDSKRSGGPVVVIREKPAYWIWITLSLSLDLISSTRAATLRAKS